MMNAFSEFLVARGYIVLLFSLYFIYRVLVYGKRTSQQAQLSRKHGCEPAPTYPHMDPILGLDAFTLTMRALRKGHVLDEFTRRFNEINGGVSTFSSVFLGKRVFHTIDPENVKTILSRNFREFNHSPARKASFGYFGQGILTLDGHDWEVSRAMLRPSFTKNQVRNLPALEEHVKNLISCIPRNGCAVDLQPLFFQLTTDTISATLLGKSVYSILGTRTDAKLAELSAAVEYASEKAAIRLRIGPLASLLPDPTMSKALILIKGYVRSFVSQALASENEAKSSSMIVSEPNLNDSFKDESKDEQVAPSDRYIFVDKLAKSGHSADRIQAELLHVLGSGRETTAALLSTLCFILARQPTIMQRVRDEIELHVGSEIPTYKNLRNLKYLGWTINEALRLYPVAPVNQRITKKTTFLPRGGGPLGTSPVLVPAGTIINWYAYSMHRNKSFWGPDAADFNPERWDGLATTDLAWNYIPFSAGPHLCPGQEFALTETMYTLVRLVQELGTWRAADDSVWAEKMGLAVSVRSGCQVSFGKV